MVLVLTLIAVIAAGLLGYVAELTQPRIRENALRELRQGISDVLPGLKDYEEQCKDERLEIYQGKNASGETLGYAIVRTAPGFSDRIKLIFGVDEDLSKIYSLKVLEQKETPGLGAKITDDLSFLQFWQDKSISQPIRYAKPPRPKDELKEHEVNAVTGATISSEAVVAAVNHAVEDARKVIGKTDG
jgi:electron transport complex protein RnfG